MSSNPFPSLRVVAVVCLFVALRPATAAPNPDREIPGVLRVRLLEQLAPRSVVVDAPASGLDVFAGNDERPRFSLPGGARMTLVRDGRDIRVESARGTLQAPAVRIEPRETEAVTLQVGSATRSYLGSIHATAEAGSSALRLVNHVPLEDYVASVVASEYGLDDVEGSKAMAVIARTYALKALRSAEYDQVDHTLSQVYKGNRAVTARALEAARATAGEVLTYGGDLIVATYYSSSGGHTANNEDVWQAAALPYLRGRKDAWDAVSPHRSWTWEIDADRLHAVLRDAFGADVRSIAIGERSPDGRARTLRLRGSGGRDRELSTQDFRLQIIRTFGPTALRSTLFDLRTDAGSYVFSGRGYGHGVGLSQWGAHGMAIDGKSYREILAFYYRDVRLETARVSNADGPMLAATRPSSSDPVSVTPAAAPGIEEAPTSTAGRASAALRANAAARNAARPAGWSGPARDSTASSTGRVISRRVAW